MQHDIQVRLSAPFEDSDIEWRLQYANEEKGIGIAVPYVTNRAIQQRLDKVAGAGGWKNEYIPWHSDGKKQSQLCGISIFFDDRNEWITKYDGAEDSDIEPVKGGLSDSMKRAAVQWGVGRYLYNMDTVFVDIEKSGKSNVIKKSSQPKLDDAHQRTVKKVFGTSHPAAQQPQASEPQQVKEPQSAKPMQQAQEPQEPARTQQQAQRQAGTETTDNSYCVLSAAVKPALNGQNTLMQLRGADGKTVLAYMQGTNPAIAKDVWIDNAMISQKTNGGVVFHTLDSFNIRAAQSEQRHKAGNAQRAA
jgi:hypothetical protein